MGITRLNVYAGLVGAFIVRDAEEQALGLPTAEYDIPLILCDRLVAQDGQLYYPVSDDPSAPWVMQCLGNLTLCNGKIFPYFEVEPRRYRFRLINVANTSFFDLSLSHDRAFQQVASDQGLLSAPLERDRIELYPAERADVVIDFSSTAGQSVQIAPSGTRHRRIPRAGQGRSRYLRVASESACRATHRSGQRRTRACHDFERNRRCQRQRDDDVASTASTGPIRLRKIRGRTAWRPGASSISPAMRIRFICTWCVSRSSIDGRSIFSRGTHIAR